jgi:hypothetical protein
MVARAPLLALLLNEPACFPTTAGGVFSERLLGLPSGAAHELEEAGDETLH